MTQRFCQKVESSEVLPTRKLTLFQTEYGKAEAKGPEKQWKFLVVSNQDGSKITADDDCSHEIKRRLLLGRKAMTNLGSILKSRDITLLTKVCLVKSMVFPVVMYRCESWTIKKTEH